MNGDKQMGGYTEIARGALSDLRGLTLDQIEARAIRESFVRNNGNRSRMAQELGVSRSTLLRKLDALGLRQQRIYYSLGRR